MAIEKSGILSLSPGFGQIPRCTGNGDASESAEAASIGFAVSKGPIVNLRARLQKRYLNTRTRETRTTDQTGEVLFRCSCAAVIAATTPKTKANQSNVFIGNRHTTPALILRDLFFGFPGLFVHTRWPLHGSSRNTSCSNGLARH